MHPSHQAQSSSKQKVNRAPPSSAISEEREGEHPQRRAASGSLLPKNIKCSGRKDTGQRKDAARQRHPGGGEQHDTLPHLSRLGATSTAPNSPIPPVCKAEGTRRLAPTQHHSSSNLSLTPLLPWGEECWGHPWEPPGGRSSSSTLSSQAEATSHSGSTALTLAGTHTRHNKPQGTSFPLDSGRASHTSKALPHRGGAALPAVKCCQGTEPIQL